MSQVPNPAVLQFLEVATSFKSIDPADVGEKPQTPFGGKGKPPQVLVMFRSRGSGPSLGAPGAQVVGWLASHRVSRWQKRLIWLAS